MSGVQEIPTRLFMKPDEGMGSESCFEGGFALETVHPAFNARVGLTAQDSGWWSVTASRP